MEISGDGAKAIIVKTGTHTALVIESRRPVGYSSGWSSSDRGLFVYELNTTTMNDRSGEGPGDLDCGNNRAYAKWAFLIAPVGSDATSNECRFEKFLVKEGKAVAYNNVQISLAKSFGTFDQITVTID